ncbi:MAG TPA: peptide deformylase [Bacillota bacterium]|nr:peptide deformylase [Bacillota bacterium]
MALLNIRLEDDDVLRKISRPVEKITPRVLRLIDDMRETLAKANGVGLAAPQVGVLRRIVIVDIGDKVLELINPEIIAGEGEQEELEGCLSCPGKWGVTKRPEKVKIKALDRNGQEQIYTGTGIIARAFCHETDHLDGVLFIDKAVRMVDPSELESE